MDATLATKVKLRVIMRVVQALPHFRVALKESF
jgi:hypothetical protein